MDNALAIWNISFLQGKLPAWIKLPQSVALPFGSFEAVLEDVQNLTIKQHLTDFMAEEHVNSSVIQAAVMDLHVPNGLQNRLEAAFAAEGERALFWSPTSVALPIQTSEVGREDN